MRSGRNRHRRLIAEVRVVPDAVRGTESLDDLPRGSEVDLDAEGLGGFSVRLGGGVGSGCDSGCEGDSGKPNGGTQIAGGETRLASVAAAGDEPLLP